ncbi:MAG: hypothetical protein GY820_29760 [Gammaproteobacteria bacterium]|nr:hypothetical protein [Gammaproteobacteria bacterium]
MYTDTGVIRRIRIKTYIAAGYTPRTRHRQGRMIPYSLRQRGSTEPDKERRTPHPHYY